MLSLLAASRDLLHEYDFSLALLDDEPRQYIVPDWLTVHQLGGKFGLVRSIGALLNLSRRMRPDVTLSFLTRANISSVAVAKLLGHRTIISERVNTTNHFGTGGASSKFARAMVRFTYPLADQIIAVSQGIADDLSENFGVPHGKISVIANPVDSARIRESADETVKLPVDGPFLIAISRLSKNKNAILAVEALAQSDTDLPLVILGEGPERATIVARAQELGIADRVIMPGFVANPYPILRVARCYLSGSNAEGFPNGLIEALALGVPAISTNCPSGPSEILAASSRGAVNGILHGEYGTLVPQDDPAAMAQALRETLVPARAEALRKAGPRRAADYSIEKARDRYWAAIKAVLAN